MIPWLEIPGSFADLINKVLWKWAAVSLLVIAILWLIYHKGHIVVPEKQVAVVYNTNTHGFSRFLFPGRHMLIPGMEHIRANISMEPRNTKGCCQARTQDGIPVTLSWQLCYRIEPLNIDSDQCVNAVRCILNQAESTAFLQTSHCIRELFEHYKLEDLSKTAIQNRVKRQLTRLVAEQLHPWGISVETLSIAKMRIPAEVETKRLAQLVRAIRINQGTLSEAEFDRLVRLDSPPEPVRETKVPAIQPGRRIPPPDQGRSFEFSCPDSLAYTAIQGLDIPSDASIGKVVV